MERPEWAHTKLARLEVLVRELLQDLTAQDVVGQDAEGRDIVRLAAMPKTAIVHAQGLAFVRRRKVGCLVAVTNERVVLIGRTTLPDGTAVWSGPVFLRGRSFGGGLTMGAFTMRMCLAIMNERGMAGVLRPHHNLGVNASFLLDMNGARLRRLRTSSAGTPSQVLTDPDGGMMAKYYLLEAGMVDFSCRGGMFGLDDAMNAAIYGPGVDVRAVLACQVPAPPEFQPVYNLLNQYVRDVKAAHPRMTAAHDRSVGTALNTLAISRHSSLQGLGHSSDELGGTSPPRERTPESGLTAALHEQQAAAAQAAAQQAAAQATPGRLGRSRT